MSQPTQSPLRHPVLSCADALEEALKDVADVEPVFMATGDKAEALLRLTRLGDQLEALRLCVLAVAGDVADEAGARRVSSWLSHRTRTERPACRRAEETAAALAHRWHQVAAGFRAGDVNRSQVAVIVRVLEDLPGDLPSPVVTAAEAELVARAAEFGPRELEVLGRRILEVVAPDVVEAEEGKKLEAEERRARETTSLTSRRLGDGATRISIKVPDALAARLQTYLESFASPRQSAAEKAAHDEAPAERVPTPRRLGQAFCALLEAIDPKRLPLHGGDATTVIVTIDLGTLRESLGAAGVATSTGPDGQLQVSAAEARRLACTANLVPAVLGTRSELLDLGRAARLFKPAQRKALAMRDRTCRAEGCDVPAAWCEAHHLVPWTRGGATDLANGILLCSWHHHRIHDSGYTATRLPNGDLRYRRRT